MFQRTASLLKIDLSEVTETQEHHELLADAFAFPDYWGRNWDAFDECVRDVTFPAQVQIAGLEALRARLPREAELLAQCIYDFVVENPRRHVRFIGS